MGEGGCNLMNLEEREGGEKEEGREKKKGQRAEC